MDGQLQQIIYQSPTQNNQITTEQPAQYVIQEEEPQIEQTYGLVNNQPNQVFYSDIQRDNILQQQQQASQQHIQNTIQQQIPQNQQIILQQYRPGQQILLANTNTSPLTQQQQIIIQNVPQQNTLQVNAPQNTAQNVVLQQQAQQFQNDNFIYDQVIQQQNNPPVQTEQIHQVQADPIQIQNMQDQQMQMQNVLASQQSQIQNHPSPHLPQQSQSQPHPQQIIDKSVGPIVRRQSPVTKQIFFTRSGNLPNQNAVKIIHSPNTAINPQIRFQSPNQIRPQRIITTVANRPRNAVSFVRAKIASPRPVDQTMQQNVPSPGLTTTQVRPRIINARMSSPRVNTGISPGTNVVRLGSVVRNSPPSITTKPVAVQTSTPVKAATDSGAEDLEESIAAAKITKPPNVASPQIGNMVQLTNGNIITIAEFKQRQQLQQQQQQLQPQQQQLQQQIQQKQIAVGGGMSKVRPKTPAPQIVNRKITQQVAQIAQAPEPIDQQKSARMLVILQNGEQRLITFTLPKESCTVQELLEQVGVPFSADTSIQCIPNPGANIDYLVTVGVSCTEPPSEIIQAAQNSLQSKTVQQQTQGAQEVNQSVQKKFQDTFTQKDGTTKNKIDNKDRFVPGMLAVCSACGYSSQDHYQCQR